MATLQQIFQQSFDEASLHRKLPLHHHKAASHLSRCRTAAMGGHIQACPEGHVERVWYNSCRHRACPQCNTIQIARWLDRQRARLLDCAHHHLIFTIPHELHPLWLHNRAALMQHLFRAVRGVLMELLADPKYLGAQPAFILALHTWGRSLSLHPHIHCLIADGGLDDQQWRAPRGSCFLPARVVMAKFRGKFLAFLRQDVECGALHLPDEMNVTRMLTLLNKLGRKKWNVHIRERYDHGEGVVRYLARYVRGGPLHNHQIVVADHERVTYRYSPHDAAGPRHMTLAPAAFIQRYLQHVPEPGRHVLRAYGLYAHTKSRELDIARGLFHQSPVAPPAPLDWQTYCQRHAPAAHLHACRICGAILVRTRAIPPSPGPPSRDEKCFVAHA
jgi:hypothetical protein